MSSCSDSFSLGIITGLVSCLQVLLLMATALNLRVPEALIGESTDIVSSELRVRQRGIAEITEMIHVSNFRFTVDKIK